MNTQPPSIFSSATRRQRGFTLIELLVTVSIAAILLAVGIPSFRSTIASNRLTSTTNDLVGTLTQARSEAIRRGVRVTVCMSANGTACATTGTWEQGWISFTDATRSGTTAAVDTDEVPPLSVTQRETGSIVIKGNNEMVQYVSFSSDGTARNMLGGAGDGILRVCDSSSALTNANRARDLEVTLVGRLSTTTPSSVAAACPAP